MEGNLETRISRALENEFKPAALEVRNTTANHVAHRKPEDGKVLETHFYVRVKSSAFNGMVNRHRLVYKALEFAFEKGLHAIEMDCDSDVQE
ncbi:BolA-like protein [Encephalitozoon intestinalis ATCC 50506]|uniref:BolA-like protein n=1 Tax=Encephalitozoon intestinalis (strain ATCC 50506) TaxID=876142 RepID=W8PKL4_ENCIT|nr:BolA-like protein [Encephalitozoon intestinalis ATCC 50506]AHL30165.1 BolA-like protein [Encephalitozoon intestinalis ATCC 50506]UTX46389.1 BolA-like protein [Encephalitozoon intestinalis]